MGEIKVTGHPEKDLSVCTVLGAVTAAQVQEQIHRNLLTETPARFVLWDVRNGALTAVSPSEWVNIIASAIPHAHRRADGKSAIVSPRDVDYGLSRMFEQLVEVRELPIDIKVVRTVREAEGWFGFEIPELD